MNDLGIPDMSVLDAYEQTAFLSRFTQPDDGSYQYLIERRKEALRFLDDVAEGCVNISSLQS